MIKNYTDGIAFVLEGSTEKIFYLNLLKYFADIDKKIVFKKVILEEEGEIFYEWTSETKKIIIKIYVVGTITQISNSGKWFLSKCSEKLKIPWSVYLCYDTDSPKADISKFYEGDWKRLREVINKGRTKKIVDLAASADIEDILLYDLEGICGFLNIPVPDTLTGRKGKAKMKALYRSCGATYHEGDRAENMINALNKEKIITNAPLDLQQLKKDIFGEPEMN